MAQAKSRRSVRGAKGSQPRAMERTVPQSPEAEVALLGSLFFDPTVIGVAAELVNPDDFYLPSNRVVAQVIWDLWNDNESIDPTIVLEELRKRKDDMTAGGQEGLLRLADAVPEASHAGYYAKIVREKSVLRQMITSCQEIISDCYDAAEELDTLLDRSESLIYKIAHGSSTDAAYHISTLLKEAIQAIDERGHAEGIITGIDTGYADLNDKTAGFQPGELLVLAARPSVGKSTFALNLIDRVALEADKPVALFSLEMSAQQIARNMLCSHAHIDAHRLRTGYLEAKHYSRIMPAVGKLSEAKIFIDDTSSLTPFMLKARARRLKAKHDIQLVVVDYLQLMDSQRAENRQLEIAYISRQLKGLAKELDLPVLAISQLSRAVEQREGKRPRLSDLRESGAIEQDADVVMFLHRPDYQEREAPVSGRPSETELIIAKQRNGPTGTVDLLFFRETLRFEPRTRDRVQDEYAEEIAVQEP